MAKIVVCRSRRDVEGGFVQSRLKVEKIIGSVNGQEKKSM